MSTCTEFGTDVACGKSEGGANRNERIASNNKTWRHKQQGLEKKQTGLEIAKH